MRKKVLAEKSVKQGLNKFQFIEQKSQFVQSYNIRPHNHPVSTQGGIYLQSIHTFCDENTYNYIPQGRGNYGELQQALQLQQHPADDPGWHFHSVPGGMDASSDSEAQRIFGVDLADDQHSFRTCGSAALQQAYHRSDENALDHADPGFSGDGTESVPYDCDFR